MADSMAQAAPQDGETRRDFLQLVTASFAAVGVGAMAWPFISSMNPARDVLALSTTEVDLTPIATGSAVTVMWRGKPVFVRNRTARGDQGGPRRPALRAEGPADRPGAGEEGQLAGAGRRLHPSRLRAARPEADRPARRLRRLVLPLPRQPLRHLRPHPEGPGAAEPRGAATTPSTPTARSRSAEEQAMATGLHKSDVANPVLSWIDCAASRSSP